MLDLYPVVTTYPMGTLSSTPDAVVDLGHGVAGQLYRAEDPRQGLRYTLLTFSWRLPVDMALLGGYTGPPAQLTQRITLLAVDDHRAGAPFPEPGNATLDGIRTAVEPVGRDPAPRSGSDLAADEQCSTTRPAGSCTSASPAAEPGGRSRRWFRRRTKAARPAGRRRR